MKRLVKGLSSDNNGVKRGFFLAFVGVLRAFKAQLSLQKVLVLVEHETKTSKTFKNPEVHALVLGKLMCLSAVVEAEAYT